MKVQIPWLFVALWTASFVWNSTTLFIWTSASFIILIIILVAISAAEKKK